MIIIMYDLYFIVYAIVNKEHSTYIYIHCLCFTCTCGQSYIRIYCSISDHFQFVIKFSNLFLICNLCIALWSSKDLFVSLWVYSVLLSVLSNVIEYHSSYFGGVLNSLMISVTVSTLIQDNNDTYNEVLVCHL